MLVDYEKLQNGSDIRGIAIGGAGKKVNLVPQVAKFIAYGFVRMLENKINAKAENLKIAVGIDSRLSGPDLKAAVIEELTDLGCSVYDCSMATTPAMFMTTVLENYKCDGSIMITASHLPYYYNGLKFFTKEGGCEKEDIQNILSIASKEESYNSANLGEVSKVDLIDEYSKILAGMIRRGADAKVNYDKPLAGFKIVVDAGNGAGGFFAYKVLKTLGADITGSQFTDPDGTFPNHIPNPENKEAMESIRNAVLENRADLGIIFDTDVDRAAIVDSHGMEINKNALIALISSIVLEEHPNSIIVTDSITSTGLGEFINKSGGIHHRFKRGYRNVINEAVRLNNEGKESDLAIETSGHAALKENYFLDDGAYLIAKILIKMAKLNAEGKRIESLIKDLKMPCESTDFRIEIRKENFREYGSRIIGDLESYANRTGFSIVPNNYEGIRVACNKANGDGWFLLRLSLHEPVLALNIESDTKGGTQIIIDKLLPFLEKYDQLEISSIK
ncbi:phosphoglucomutase/phosphomannomutase alpha/beta/alpha domain I [Clostridium sp. DL-VIII]|uniref:phosphoglucomutase n=1 Tax=Clostridium sp. DL-VIII TaxID=641107 RepID=UPI00023AFF9C|nr:phosphoglucomutase [Clostridium sp. DL-VIII]EHI99121.1 phosphoglucomutase/phosphomannomutase alpha/beta/alpha domain I [Clostridium sp. DL-VIII]